MVTANFNQAVRSMDIRPLKNLGFYAAFPLQFGVFYAVIPAAKVG